jgi:peptidyl-prolyl cis-trans isomerase C
MTDRSVSRTPSRAARAALCCAAGLAATLLLAGPVAAQEEEDPLAARVEGREIHRSDVINSAQDLPPAYLEQMETIYPFLRDRLVGFELIAIDGRAEGLADDPEVQEMVRQFEDEAIRHIYLTRFLETAITDELAQERYDAFVAAQPPVDEVRARHILVDSEEAAREIINELNNGADFATLAKERSTDRASAEQNGGDLGYFVHDEMVTPFADAAFELETGAYTEDPVQTDYGWHVILVEDHRVRAAPPLEEMREEIESQIAGELIQERLNELRADADVELFDYAGEPDEPADESDLEEPAIVEPAATEEPAEGETADPAAQ